MVIMENVEKIIRFDQLWPRGNFPVMVRDTYQDEFAAAHAHDYIEIALVHNGRGTHLNHFKDGKVLANTIIKGDLFTILPGEVHSYANCKSYLVYNLCIGVDFFRTLYAEVASRGECLNAVYLRAFAEHKYFMGKSVTYLAQKGLISARHRESADRVATLGREVLALGAEYHQSRDARVAQRLLEKMRDMLAVERQYLPKVLEQLQNINK